MNITNRMPAISLMFKPSSSLCNMRCEYCFYHSLADCRENFSYGLMDLDIFECAFIKAVNFTKGNPINIAFQGGEPLIIGLEFFQAAIEIVHSNNKYNSVINYSLQTNGLLINEAWCNFFVQNNFLLGVSIDGRKTENAYRIDVKGKETYDRVIESVHLLQKHKVNFNVLVVLTPIVARNIKEVYRFFVSKNIRHMQFIPCLSPLGELEKSVYTVSTDEYTQFLFDLFEEYLKDFITNNYVSVRLFDNMVLLANGKPAEQCGLNGHCSYQFIIEGDGTVFPCDFYCVDEYNLGNIKETDFFELCNHPIATEFIKSSFKHSDECKKCPYLQVCRGGGCKRESLDIAKCKSYKKFLKHALPHMLRMS